MKCACCKDEYTVEENDHPVIEFFNIFSIALCPKHLNDWRFHYLRYPEMEEVEALKVQYNFVAYWMQRAPDECSIHKAIQIDKEIGVLNLKMAKVAEEYFKDRS